MVIVSMQPIWINQKKLPRVVHLVQPLVILELKEAYIEVRKNLHGK
jgi:hypothetical protein